MPRRWTSFNREVTNKEFLTLSPDDFADLTRAMKSYRLDEGKEYQLKNYGDGLMMLRSSSGT